MVNERQVYTILVSSVPWRLRQQAGPQTRKAAMAVTFTSAPVDPARFTALVFMGCEPKLDRETGQQHTTKDGFSRKWTVNISAAKPSPYDSARTEVDALAVTVTSEVDPADGLVMGTPVTLDGFTVGVMAPEAGEGGKIRGGRLFWSATGVRAKVPAGK
jgi:hypothetical protein